MNNLTLEKLTMSSREIANLTNKRHRDVLRDIRKMFDGLEINERKFALIEKDAINRDKLTYQLPKDLTITLVAGYRIDLRHKIVKRWMELEEREITAVQPRLEMTQLAEVISQSISNALTNSLPSIMSACVEASVKASLKAVQSNNIPVEKIGKEEEVRVIPSDRGFYIENDFRDINSWLNAYGLKNPKGGWAKDLAVGGKIKKAFFQEARLTGIPIKKGRFANETLFPSALVRPFMKREGKAWIKDYIDCWGNP